MATRRSLVSRGFTSTAAGPSSTNRFLKPPRTVSEYKTVAQEVADLRTTKNAVGPAAQPLRPRARVEQQQISEGGNIDTSYQAGSRSRASVRGSEASLETNKGIRGAVDSFGSITATDNASKKTATAIGIGGTILDALTAGISKPITAVMSGVATYAAYKTSKELTDPLYGTPADTVQRSINKTVEEIEGLPEAVLDQISSVPVNVLTGAKAGFNALTSLVTKAEPVNQQRKSRVERAEQSTINKNTREIAADLKASRVYNPPVTSESLRSVKQKAQVGTITSRNAANASITIGNYGSSGSDDGSFDSGADKDGNATGQDQYD